MGKPVNLANLPQSRRHAGRRAGAGAPAGRAIGLFFEVRGVDGEDVLRGIQSYVRQRGVPWNFYLAALAEASFEELQNQIELNGLIISSDVAIPMNADRLIRERGIPVVEFWDNRADQIFPTIVADDRGVGQAIAEHFLARGFERFGFLGFAAYPRFAQTRLAGFRAAVQAAGKDVIAFDNPAETWENYHLPSQRHCLDQWVNALAKPIAIMAPTDIRARHLVGSCRRVGLRIPEDIAICGVDNRAVCEADTPALSSVPLNLARLGYEAAQLLDRLMKGDPPPAQPIRIAPFPLIVRQSSDVYAAADSDVQTALRFIHGQASRNLRVEQVVDSVLISRSGLQKKFRVQLGRTIQEEIWRAHVERAKRLLTATRDDLRSIAKACGFRSPQRFSQVFHQHAGLSPSDYRHLHDR